MLAASSSADILLTVKAELWIRTEGNGSPRLLLTAVKQGAIDPEGRVKTLLRKRGVNGVLEEIASIKGDHAKRIYFQALLKNESLNRSDLQSVLEATRTQIRSDHEKANLLKQSADLFLGDSTLSESYFEAISTIDSDYEQRQTLSALLQKTNLSEAVLAQMLDSLDDDLVRLREG